MSLRSDGEFIAIVGPSGCGKSTFLHMLGGFEPVSEGELLFNGLPVAGPGPDRGMVFQEFALYPWRTVERNVTWGLEVQGRSRAEQRAIADRVPEETLRLKPDDVRSRLSEWKSLLTTSGH